MQLNAYAAGLAVAAMVAAAGTARAGVIPYADIGTPNQTTYSFTAAATGDVVAYFAGSGAAYEDRLGMLVNGVLSRAGYGLDDHSSAIGDSFNLGFAHAGDSIVFVLHDLTLNGMNAYSDPTMNGSYDLDGSVGHNHIYSTAYRGGSADLPGVPAGTYVAFEDLQFPLSDFNYFDETFVVTNVNGDPPQPVPEPSSLDLFSAALLSLGAAAARRGNPT